MENIENVAVEEKETVEAVENSENVEATATEPQAVSKSTVVKAKLKEWFRKKIVNLKRKPQNIAFLVLIISTVYYLLSLSTLSPGPTQDFSQVTWLGFCIFVNALFSILVLVLFLGIFPKYPKVNKKTGKKTYISIAKIVLTALFMLAMIAMDILYYQILVGTIAGNEAKFFASAAEAQKYISYLTPGFDVTSLNGNEGAKPYLLSSLTVSIVHIVLVGISGILLATLPLYKKLILKINTSKEVDFNNSQEVIDIED
ncbi:MAG: hypothetical protein ACI4MC_00405 [Candidatus Coproplasma sp.]